MTNKEKIAKFAIILKNRIAGAEVGNNSVIIAFYLLLSLFPVVIVAGNLMALLNLNLQLLPAYLEMIVPEAVMPLLTPILSSLLVPASGGWLSLGVLAALWTSSRGVSYLQTTIDKAYGLFGQRNAIFKRFFSFVIILLIILLLAVFAIIFSVGDVILEAFSENLTWAGTLLATIKGFKWPVTLGFLFCLLCLVYRLTPAAKMRLKDALPGALFGTLALVLLVQAFTFYIYVSISARAFSGYGIASTFFVMMFWLKFSATIVILGAALNAAVAEYRFGKPTASQSSIDKAVQRTQSNLAQKARSFAIKKWPNANFLQPKTKADEDDVDEFKQQGG